MERTDILELMSRLKLFGMRAAYDELMAAGIKRRHEPPRIVGDLLSAEIAEKSARSIKYQLTIAKLPLAPALPAFRAPLYFSLPSRGALPPSQPPLYPISLHGPACSAMPDDHRAPRPPDPSLRDHRNRKQVLALQEPRLSATPACPGGQTGTSHASLRQTRGGHSTMRGSLLFATGTSLSQRR